MRLLIILITTIFSCTFSAKAQYVTIPDPDFKNYLMMNYPGCFNASGMMDTTCTDIVNATYFTHSDQVANWEGFQYFRNLQTINFNGFYFNGLPALPATLKYLVLNPVNSIPTLPALPNGLLTLYCSNFSITSLPALPPGLLRLELSAIDLQALPILPSGLTYLSCYGVYGLQSLPALPASLVHLNFSDNFQVTTLPALPANLRYIDVHGCQLTSLPALPVSLDTLFCNNNYLTLLPALPAQTDYLNANNNQLTSLPALPAQMDYLDAGINQLTSLPTLSGTTLQTLIVNNNSLSSIPTLPSTLQTLMLAGNQVASLPALPAGLLHLNYIACMIPVMPALPAGLRELVCSGNQISNISTLPDSLRILSCDNNQLTSLPVLPHYLTDLSCSYNQLTSLPDLPATLLHLACQRNNINCLPVLPDGDPANIDLFFLLEFDNIIGCVANLPTHYFDMRIYDGSGNPTTAYTYPVCNPTNNVNHCAAFPLMTGHVYYDNNNNGIYDTGEPYKANVKVQLSNGAYTFSNNNGYYQLSATGTGNYSTTITNLPGYFTSAPAQYNFNFSSYDTLVVNDFGLQATAIVDSLAIAIIPIQPAARPGFSYPYEVLYENIGTTTLNPNIVFNYDNTRLIYDSCSNPSVINTGSSLVKNETGFVPGMQKSFIGYFRVNPTAVIGDSLRSGAHIISGNAAAHDSDVVAIRGAFDPNDKSATPVLSPAQVANGNYIYYTIRFQNTGTDTAFSIVVTDTLNSLLQPATMQMIGTSHPCITTVKGNTVSFEFINIMLPDSNVNELKSHGFISFRIKPQSNVVLNNTIPNKASIYFDYNSPVITNNAVTTISNPIVVPLKLLSFIVSKGAGQLANLYWQTNNEVNVQRYEIEMSSNGRVFNNIGFETAKGYQYNNYTKIVAIPNNDILYFRLKMMDIDGNYAYSNIAILKNSRSNAAFSFLNNPIRDELSISLQDENLRNTTATILNSQGAKIKTIFLQSDVEHINVKSFSAGTYYLVTEKGSRQFVVIK